MQQPVSIVLASTSPRRKKLMTDASYKFKVVAPEVDESHFSSAELGGRKFAEKLALAKAQSVAPQFPDSVVIGADTIVDFDGQIIGKPADSKDAVRITKMLFSAPHKVITALAIVRTKDSLRTVQSDVTIVYPRQLSSQQIAGHIKGNSWRGKAGAYGIQETGDEFVERLEGSITNVMGMPMELLARMLGQLD